MIMVIVITANHSNDNDNNYNSDKINTYKTDYDNNPSKLHIRCHISYKIYFFIKGKILSKQIERSKIEF